MLNHSENVYSSDFKGTVQVFHECKKTLAKTTNGHFLKRIFKQNVADEMFGIRLLSGNLFFDIIDRKLQQLFTAGIIEYYESDYKSYLNQKRYEHLNPDGPKVLTMNDLNAGFVIWIVSVSFAIFAFLCELIVGCYQKSLKVV